MLVFLAVLAIIAFCFTGMSQTRNTEKRIDIFTAELAVRLLAEMPV